MITATGERRLLSEATVGAETMRAVKLSFGMFGILARIQLKVVPAFRVIQRDRLLPRESVLDGVRALVDAHDAVDLYWFPFTDKHLGAHARPHGRAPHAPGPRARIPGLQLLPDAPVQRVAPGRGPAPAPPHAAHVARLPPRDDVPRPGARPGRRAALPALARALPLPLRRGRRSSSTRRPTGCARRGPPCRSWWTIGRRAANIRSTSP